MFIFVSSAYYESSQSGLGRKPWFDVKGSTALPYVHALSR